MCVIGYMLIFWREELQIGGAEALRVEQKACRNQSDTEYSAPNWFMQSTDYRWMHFMLSSEAKLYIDKIIYIQHNIQTTGHFDPIRVVFSTFHMVVSVRSDSQFNCELLTESDFRIRKWLSDGANSLATIGSMVYDGIFALSQLWFIW